jgi:hypothetical protein
MNIILHDLEITSSFINKIQQVDEIQLAHLVILEFHYLNKLKSFKGLHYYS